MLIEDERDLRAGLRALSAAGVPPPDLAERSAARARSRRRQRVTFTGALVAGAAAVLLLPVVLPQVSPRPIRPATTMSTSLRTWPDLRVPAWTAAADVALAEYEKSQIHVRPPDTHVRWLYANLVPGTDEVVVAWAYCGAVECPRVVLAQAQQGEALLHDDDPSSSYWSNSTGDIGTESPIAPLSTYLNGRAGDRGDTTVVLAVVPPGTQEVAYETPRGRAGSGGSGTLRPALRAFVGDIGYVTHPTVLHLRGSVKYSGQVGVPADDHEHPRVGNAPDVAEVKVPAAYRQGMATRLQMGSTLVLSDQSPDGRLSVFTRCEGSGPLVITYRHGGYAIACDGKQTEIVLDEHVKGRVEVAISGGDAYTSAAVALGYR
jgi:hypothetical protein